MRTIPVLLSIALAAAAAGCAGQAAPDPAVQEAAKVERGRYLVSVLGCNDCHTPLKMGARGPEPDMTRMLSGHPEGFPLGAPPAIDPATGWAWAGNATNTAFVGPWGVSYARNLTPDEATGMGIWTEEMFVKSLRTGKQFGSGRPVLPPMPWPGYSHLTDEDAKAIYAFLRSIPPIRNQVPDSIPASAPGPPAAASAPRPPREGVPIRPVRLRAGGDRSRPGPA